MKRVLILGATTILLALGGCDSGNTQSTQESAQSSRTVMSREEFRQAIAGKSPDQVIASVGRPDRTDESTGARGELIQYWYYDGAAKDEITGNVGKAQVVIENGQVYRVNF